MRSIAGDLRARLRGPRLAYIDAHFPWHRSGFRYADALALYRARPDTVFFSMYEMRDSFPAPVHALAQFPRLAASMGVTDVYGVFLGFMAGMLGLRQGSGGDTGRAEGLDLSGVLSSEGIRAHVGLYPGGGFVQTEAGFAEVRRLVEVADVVISWSPAVIEHVPGVAAVEPSIIDTGFYSVTARDLTARPLELLFVADAKARKGLGVALAALRELTDQPVHLHVVGPHDHASWNGPDARVTFHGWLEREDIRDLHRDCHVFLSPVAAERPEDPGGDGGVTDGFPTTAAGEALSSGCLLISANPDADHRALRPDIDYIEVPATASQFAEAIRSVLRDPAAAAAIAASGSLRVRERLDVNRGVETRLKIMGLDRGHRQHGRARRAQRVRRGKLVPDESVPALTSELRALSAAVEALTAEQTRREAEQKVELATLRGHLVAISGAILDDEASIRRLLEAARMTPEYERPFTDPSPLVSICIPTCTNVPELVERAVPSALAQHNQNIEVVVVGDGAAPETEAAIKALGDLRVRYETLSVRGPHPEDPHRRWMAAGAGPLNRSIELARGAWITILNDGDALRPDHASTLVAAAQAARAEVAFGRFEQHGSDGTRQVMGAFPPETHRFGWQCEFSTELSRGSSNTSSQQPCSTSRTTGSGCAACCVVASGSRWWIRSSSTPTRHCFGKTNNPLSGPPDSCGTGRRKVLCGG